MAHRAANNETYGRGPVGPDLDRVGLWLDDAGADGSPAAILHNHVKHLADVRSINVGMYSSICPRPSVRGVKAILTRSDVTAARRLLQDLARRLATDYPSAAASVREGLDEPLTVIGLRLSKRLQRSLATTNAIESLLSRTRHVQRHVKRWRGGTMVLRWVAAGVLEAANGFPASERVSGHAHAGGGAQSARRRVA